MDEAERLRRQKVFAEQIKLASEVLRLERELAPKRARLDKLNNEIRAIIKKNREAA